ncbi:hypothetical protein, partial [Rhizobium sp. NPDC090279]|uniref:hypothetical protein n=1 Tax=Rhizobium sp. NPDC090279 TaxID=3364499 RepID=UPI00383A011D
HEPGVTSNEGRSKPGIGERESVGIIYCTGSMMRCCGRHFLLDWNGPVTEVLTLVGSFRDFAKLSLHLRHLHKRSSQLIYKMTGEPTLSP